MTTAEKLAAAGWDGITLFDNPSYDDALIGVTECGRAVYDFDKMVGWLVANTGMLPEEAVEWIEYNTVGALPDAGPFGPIIFYKLPEDYGPPAGGACDHEG